MEEGEDGEWPKLPPGHLTLGSDSASTKCSLLKQFASISLVLAAVSAAQSGHLSRLPSLAFFIAFVQRKQVSRNPFSQWQHRHDECFNQTVPVLNLSFSQVLTAPQTFRTSLNLLNAVTRKNINKRRTLKSDPKQACTTNRRPLSRQERWQRGCATTFLRVASTHTHAHTPHCTAAVWLAPAPLPYILTP